MMQNGSSNGLSAKRVPLDSLHVDPSNARRHPARNLETIRGSLEQFGQVEPLVVQKGTGKIIGGNGRFEVLRAMGRTHADVVEVDIDGHEATALGIALNRTADLAEWDDETLASLLDSLNEADALDMAGFDEGEFEALMKDLTPEVDIVEDEAPEPPVDPITQPGDLWELGRHRVLCGDSTDADDVSRLLDGETPFLMVTDPPYGVEYDPKWRLESGLNKPHQTRAEGTVENDDNARWCEAWRLFPGTVAYVWHGALQSSFVAQDLLDSRFELRAQIIWVKPSLVIGRGAYHWRHEPCWYGSRGTAKWSGDRKQSTAWDIPNMHRTQGDVDDGKTVHGTQKPVECMARPIRNHGSSDDDVYDPFLGSGTTLIAAEQLGRTCYGMEISPAYCDVIVKRWEALTGEKATRIPATETVENG